MKTTTREGFLMNTFRRIPRYMAKALAAGAVLVAATLPLAVATEAGAAVISVPASSYLLLTAGNGLSTGLGAAGSPAIFAQGWTGTGTLVLNAADATNLAGSGNATVTSTAVGVTFSAGAESVSGATQVVTTITAGAAVPAGYYPATITDGTGTVTIPNAFYVDAAPTFTSITPASIPGGNTNIPAVVTGTGFTPTTSVLFGVGSVGGTITPSGAAYVSPTTMNVVVTTNGKPTGLYAGTVANTDGGTTTATTGLTVTGPTITSISPASLAVPATGSATTTVTFTGTGFETGAVVSITANGTGVTVGTVTYTSSTSMSVALTVASGTTAEQSTLKITNPDLSSAVSTAGLGIGTASAAAATVTAVSPSLSLTIGSVANLTITGTGFGPVGNTHAAVAFLSTAGTVDTHVVCSAVTVTSDTSLTCTLAVSSGAISGPHAVEVLGNSGNTVESNALASALTILGPTITSVFPASIPADFVGILTLTGTGFSSGTLSATVAAAVGTDAETGVTVQYVSSTQVTVTNTGPTTPFTGAITALDSPAIVTLTDNGALANFAVPVVIPPTVSTVVYAAHTTGVGQGATAQPIVIVGTGFLPAATVTFGTTSGISATVVSVTPTAITATVKVSTTAAQNGNTFTVTNTNGGSTTGSLNVDAGVGVLSWSPTSTITTASVKNGTTGTLVLYSTGIAAGATVASSNGLVTLGTPVVTAGTKISIPWTAAAIVGTVPVGLSLTVSNLDGGASTFALSVAPGPTVVGAYYVPTSSTNFEVTIVGTGFENGMTVASSNAIYTVSLANINATNTAATLLVTTTAAATSGTFSTITFTNPDGGTTSFALNGGPAPVVTPVVVVALHASGVHGVARVGKTVTLTISGTGFYGQPKITSTGAGVRATVSHDNGKLLTVRVTVPAKGAKGEHTFKITLANGKSCKVNYATK